MKIKYLKTIKEFPFNTIVSAFLCTLFLTISFFDFIWPKDLRFDHENSTILNDLSLYFAKIFLYILALFIIMLLASVLLASIFLTEKKYKIAFIWILNFVISILGASVSFQLFYFLKSASFL